MTRTAAIAAIAALTVLAAIVAIIAADFATPAQAQSDGETAGRIAAHRLADGRTELGWEPRTNAGWGERILPSGRYLPANAAIDRWLHTTPVEVEGVEIGRIEALKRRNGGIELAFRPTGGERIEPFGNYLPSNIEVGSWRHTSEITFGSPEDEAPAVSAGASLSAGGGHTCAIRESGEIECWGNNEHSQADAPAGRFSAVSAGSLHTCGLRETGTVECWGWNRHGQTDAPAGRFSAVSAGGLHTCGLRETGTVECWGNNGSGLTDAPTGRFSMVSAGRFHTCGLRETGAIECWGRNWDGQADAPAGRFSAVSAGGEHTCGLRGTGAVECWGDNGWGQADPPAGRFSAVSAGWWHTCGLRGTGAVECWGDNRDGETDALAGRFSAVSAGGWHTCGLRESGAVECWGDNEYGQTDAPAGRFSAVSAGWYHTCGLRETGAVECWGSNRYGQANAPAGRFSAVSAGGAHTCGLRESDGAITCWGYNRDEGRYSPPAGRFTAVSVGGEHICAIRESGEIACWGSNWDGVSNNTRPTDRHTAVSAGNLYTCAIRASDSAIECWGRNDRGSQTDAPAGRFSAVSAGGSHTCGLRETGTVECWGWNRYGQTDAPAGRFSAVSAGWHHTCGLRETGAAVCWGYNDGGQADAPAGRFSAVSAGWQHTCGLRETGAVECWGLSSIIDAPSGRFRVADVPELGCPEPAQLFRVTATTSTTPTTLTRPAHLDTECQVDGLSASRVRPADRYEFTLDRPARVSVELISDAFAPYLFLTDANGAYFYRVGTEREGGTWFSLSESRAADGEGSAIITQAGGAAGGLQPAAFGLRLEPGTYWLFAVSESGPRTGDYRLEVEWERIGDNLDDQQIAERFAPVIHFEQDEDYFPVPVDLMIQHSTLHYTQNGQERTKAPGTYGLADLISHNGQEAYLDLADEEHGSRGTGERVVYARVVEPAGAHGGTLVQYWFFYLFNATGEALSSHEGDWESVQLWFADVAREDMHEALVPTWMGYAAHEGGWALSQDPDSCSGTDALLWPSVYVARNRHASYAESGGGGWLSEKVESLYGWPSLDKSKLQWTSGDQFHGNGQAWALQGRDVPDVEGEVGYEIRLLPEGFDGTWLAWDGRWGDLGDLGLGKDGPRGPAWKEHFWALPPILPVLKGGDDGWSEAPFRCFPRVPR